MLKIKVNKNNLVKRDVSIKDKITLLEYDRDSEIMYATAPNHGLRDKEVISFIYPLNDNDKFYSEYTIDVIDDSHFSFTFSENYKVIPYSGEHKKIFYKKGTSYNGIELNFSERGHILYEDLNEYDVKQIYHGANIPVYDRNKKCKNDYVVFCQENENGKVIDNSGFLYKAGLNNKGEYTFGNFLNYTEKMWIEDDIEFNTYTPVDKNGKNINNKLFIVPTSTISLNEMAKKASFTEFFCKDERFIKISGETGENGLILAEIKEKTDILKTLNEIRIKIPFEENFSLRIRKEDINKNDYVDAISEKTNIIKDYEKQIFEPAYKVSGDTFSIIKELDFNLHFRKRTTKEGSEMGDEDYYDNWNSDDSEYWFNYTYNTSTKKLVYTNTAITSDTQSDLVGYLGFTDNDIYNRTNKVRKSFIRLSLYDSRDRGTQKLYGYSTIFLNSNELYGNYCKKIEEGGDLPVVFTEGENRIGTTFNTFEKLEKTKPSEGFYFYLFPNLLEGAAEKDVYMKIEFNHAKYGKTIPMIMPTSGETESIIPATASGFPVNYSVFSGSSVMGIDMDRLYKDMYIKIKIKYDKNLNKYIWYMPREKDELNGNNSNKALIFNLFEPRINGNEN